MKKLNTHSERAREKVYFNNDGLEGYTAAHCTARRNVPRGGVVEMQRSGWAIYRAPRGTGESARDKEQVRWNASTAADVRPYCN